MASRLLPTLYAVSTAVAVIILGPLLRPGHLLYRDAVSTPRTHLTDTTLGIDGLPPRAVPQDWFVGVFSTVVDGGFALMAMLFAALVLAGVGYGRLAARLVPDAGRSGAAVAAIASVWNPFVAERLLQGHWGLLVGYASLGWIVLTLLDLRERGGLAQWAQLIAAVGLAGLTPSGSLLAGALLLVVGVPMLLRANTSRRLVTAAGGVLVWIVGALPWLVASAIAGTAVSSSGSAGVRAFGLRAEPGLGGLGTALGLGGIWNNDAVPASRSMWWAAVATACLLLVVATGVVFLWSHRTTLDPTVTWLATLAALTVALVAVAATSPGMSALGWLIDTVPGAGLLRDTQKFLALAVPFLVVATAAACTWARRWVPAGFAVGAATLLIVAPLPDLAWGVGGRIAPVHYPDDWARISAIITPDDGAVLLWPPGTLRRYDFADDPSLDPTPRMVRAAVLQSGELTVDGVLVDPPDPTTAAAEHILSNGGPASELAKLGVGWVLVENTATDAPRPAGAQQVFDGKQLRLYRIPDADTAAISASTGERVAVWTANLVWLGAIGVGLVLGLRRSRRTDPGTRRR